MATHNSNYSQLITYAIFYDIVVFTGGGMSYLKT